MVEGWFTTQIEAYKNTNNFPRQNFELRLRFFVAWPRNS